MSKGTTTPGFVIRTARKCFDALICPETTICSTPMCCAAGAVRLSTGPMAPTFICVGVLRARAAVPVYLRVEVEQSQHGIAAPGRCGLPPTRPPT